MSMFLTFEGLDGAGKTTQIDRLADHLRSLGHEVVVTREPGGTLAGEQLRELILQSREIPLHAQTLLLMFAASFSQSWQETIKPALDSGKIVISDRWWLSTVAYQGISGGLGADWVRSVCLGATENRVPDRTFFFDLEHTERHRRMANREGEADAIESKGDEFFEKARTGYIAAVKASPEAVLIDANGTPDEVWGNLLNQFNTII